MTFPIFLPLLRLFWPARPALPRPSDSALFGALVLSAYVNGVDHAQ